MFNRYLLFILLVIDFIWLRSSYGKLSGGKFVAGMEGTLKKFVEGNPYPLVKDFLRSVAIPNASLFGSLTMWGETLVGLSLFISLVWLLLKKQGNKLILSLLLMGLLGGAFLNNVFYLSSGWMSSSSDGLNLLMLMVEVIAAFYTFKLLTSKNA
ncbi:hypothetical protein HY387_00470 [Candidatus Daviesbacteria bacterium]|nr:hypothetical protein [Candidatus Daviesbacteria bacterium]